MIDNANDGTNFPHKLLLTNRQISNLPKALANNSTVNMRLSKNQISKIIRAGEFLGRLLGPLIKVGCHYGRMCFNH